MDANRIMRDDQVVANYNPVGLESFSLRGKVAVVTGAGQGMGRALALGLAAAGADVAVVDLNRASAEGVAREAGDRGVRAQAFELDVSCEQGVDRAFTQIRDALGSIGILVNNAGIGSASAFPEMEYAEWQRVFRINLDSVFLCTRAAARQMISAGGGAVINIGSSLSSRAAMMNCLGGSPEYCAAKAAVQAFTRSCAQFLARDGVRVNCISPGPVDSPMHALRREALAGEIVRIPLGRIQVCDDIVGPAVFLASDAARFVTGQNLHVNGGLLMVD